MPHAQILEALAGHPGGRILVATLGDDPAANTELSVTVPGRAQWQLHAIVAQLVTDANVANRRPRFQASHQGRRLWSVASTIDQTASTTVDYSLGAGVDHGGSVAAGAITLPTPPLVLMPGAVVSTVTLNLQATDNWGAPVLYVTEIPERGPDVWGDLARQVAAELVLRRELFNA